MNSFDIWKDYTKIQEYVGFDKYDVVTANILADIIIPLLGEIDVHMYDSL